MQAVKKLDTSKKLTQVLNVATHPVLASLNLGSVSLTWTQHALDRALDKRVCVTCFETIGPGSIVELERVGNKTVKLVIRLKNKRNPNFDDVLVLVPACEGLFRVVTCWRNHKSDKHASLNLERIAS